MRATLLLLSLALFLPASQQAAEPEAARAVNPNASRWRWLKGTVWIVPPNNLPAAVYTAKDNKVRALMDQTAYEITDYKDGYFWGRTVVALTDGSRQYMALIGSITPEGDVLLTFVPFDASEDALITQGRGKMTRKFGQWTMENQMTSGPNATVQIAHWAYMVRTRPDSPSWKSLPGVNVSVPAFFRDCPEAPQRAE